MTGPYFPLLHLYPWQYPQGPELNQRPHHVEITSSRLISETDHKRLINQFILKVCILKAIIIQSSLYPEAADFLVSGELLY